MQDLDYLELFAGQGEDKKDKMDIDQSGDV